MSSSDYELTPTAGALDVVARLRQWGATYLPGFLSEAQVTALRTEFHRFFEYQADWVKRIHYYSPDGDSRAVSVNRVMLDDTLFPITAKIFGSDFMQAVCNEYLSTPNEFNNAIYLTHDLPDDKAVTIFHFDRIYALKFYFYLAKTTIKNGAFEFCPGSQKQGTTARRRFLQAGYAVKDIPIWDYATDIAPPVPVEGIAGTLIIFDTDTIHRGGIVSPGTTRLIARGHSHTTPRDRCRAIVT